ncbi:hypothetical protein OIU74_007415 [Salix koriyanagi]|uniref:Uncharacterized protein n=1 Tax=Salix koriyanagi TaxID=2511006 RepID=A0A9Q0U3M4_9ROSI|nr:hypothetical protein OIU74_007415 [Salix koriyanagi]KAJ6722828.1 hypothetical protein OIU74_007415 [Salix koriyanagi]
MLVLFEVLYCLIIYDCFMVAFLPPGFREEWMKLLIFRIRLDEIHFPQLFSKLYYVSNSENGEEVQFLSTEKEYLLNLLPNISSDSLTLFHGAKLDRTAMVDLLGYSLPISRDMSHAWLSIRFVSSGLLELPLGFLHNLETPAIIRNDMKQADNPETTWGIQRTNRR